MPTSTYPSVDDFLSTWLSRLPQAARVTAADARSWYEAVVALEPERFSWHYQRLSGFGGSDIGELAAWRLGVPALFNTPQHVIAQKRMQRTIEGPNKYIRRGVLLEDDMRETFLADYGARSRPDLMQALRQARSQVHPWGRANPDDVVEMRVGGKTKLYIVDYKSASEAKEQAPTQYACQIHHYDWMLWTADSDAAPRLTGDKPLACDGLLIVYYDYAAAEVVPVEVPWDGQILRAVLEGGDLAWEHVLGLKQVDFALDNAAASSEVERLRPDEEARIADIERRMLALKLLADPMYQRYKDCTRQIDRILHDAGRRVKSKTQPPLTFFSLRYSTSVDHERLQGLCATAGIDLDSLRSDTNKLDAEAMAAKLQALGHSPVYVREYDLARVRELCAVHGYRLPLEESGIFAVSRRRAVQPLLDPLRERAKSEAARTADVMLASLVDTPEPKSGETSMEEAARPDQEMGGVRSLTLRAVPVPG